MAKFFYVSQIVEDPKQGKGVLHFSTEDETKARSEAAVDPSVRFLFVFEDGNLLEQPADVPQFVLDSVSRKEKTRFKFEQQMKLPPRKKGTE